MDSREELLNKFYASLNRTKVKLELRENSFESLGIHKFEFTLDYGELKNGVLKYKLSRVSPECFERLIQLHLCAQLSLCAYFDSQENSLFALNLDSSRKRTNEVKVAALLFNQELHKVNIRPLVIKSGRGYHLWCRLSSPVKNVTLQKFTTALNDTVVSEMIKKGASPENVNCTTYPRLNVDDISLRLFGGIHSKTGEFSSVITGINIEDTVLSADDSWAMFEWYLNHCTVSREDFEKALTGAF